MSYNMYIYINTQSHSNIHIHTKMDTLHTYMDKADKGIHIHIHAHAYRHIHTCIQLHLPTYLEHFALVK